MVTSPRNPIPPAFSLVEVVVALGITAFAVTTILALLGSVVQQGRGIVDRQYSLRMADALVEEIGTRDFSEVYDWAKTPTADARLHAFSYYAKPDGSPDPSAAGNAAKQPGDYVVSSVVLEPGDAQYSQYEAARQNKIIAATVTVSPVNPLAAGDLPGAPADYPKGYLALRLTLHALEEPGVPISPRNRHNDYDTVANR